MKFTFFESVHLVWFDDIVHFAWEPLAPRFPHLPPLIIRDDFQPLLWLEYFQYLNIMW